MCTYFVFLCIPLTSSTRRWCYWSNEGCMANHFEATSTSKLCSNSYEFHSLLAKLWDQSFLPQHLKSGFRRAWLSPLSRSAIPFSRLTKALPFSRPSAAKQMQPQLQPAKTSSSHSEAETSSHSEAETSSHSEAEASSHSEAKGRTTITVELVGTCTSLSPQCVYI